MKNSLSIIVFLVCFISYGQNPRQIKHDLKEIDSIGQLEGFKALHPSWDVELVALDKLDAIIPKKLRKLNKGKSATVKNDDGIYVYKLISETPAQLFRASYIYLNGNELRKAQIDSLRPIIIDKYKSGTPFETLVKAHNMDKNTANGDLNWFKKGTMVSGFEKAVEDHKVNDIFTVDVNRRKWYYVVLKTHSDRTIDYKNFIKVKSKR